MGGRGKRIKQLVNDQANVRLAQLGYSDGRIRDAKREAWSWFESRAGALRRRRGLYAGWAVVWTEPGRAECLPVEVPGPGPGEVTIALGTSVVSTGTERAQYLRLPNARTGYPHRPGYSGSGRVLAVGRGVDGVRVGDRVAAAGVHHASVDTVRAQAVVRLPDAVREDEAALVQLGVICGQGVRRARIAPGEHVVVFGSGLIGLLAQRLALLAGSGPVTVVARSAAKEHLARAGGAARFIALDDEGLEALDAVRAPIVIEATGDPDAIGVVVQAAAPGARVVLLGSPRGRTRELPVDEIRMQGLELVGAHVETLALEREQGDLKRAEAVAFVEHLAHGRLRVDDLLGPRVEPRDADAFYRGLAARRELASAVFDWSRLPPAAAVGRAPLLRLPELRARGVDADRPLRARLTSPARSEAREGMLRIGLIGCGDIAVHNARAVVAAPNAELVAAYDPVSTLAEELTAQHGGVATPTLDALLEREDVDAVFVAVPHHLHAPIGAEAARAGKHVVIEKPLAHSLGAALELVDAVAEAGVRLSVCFPHRYEASVERARALVASGAVGDLRGTLVNFFSDKPASYWLGGFSGRSQSNWRTSRETAGGGVLIMNLSHVLDLVRYLTGADAAVCFAATGVAEGVGDVEDTISMTVSYDGGAVGSLMGGSSLRGHRGGRTDLHVWGDDGYVVVEPELRVYLSRHANAGLRTTRWQAVDPGPPVDIRAKFVTRLAHALHRGEEPDVTAEDALAVQALIEAAYRSSETGETVRPADLLAGARV